MKYTILGILFVAALLIMWIIRTSDNINDIWLMVVAIVSVVFFASVPNIWTSMYNTKVKVNGKPDLSDPNVVQVRLPPTGSNESKIY